ncbi:MAG: hypothetical protein K2H04_07670 [Bacteroidaceae bacterium]|nr:hypothetical protein [Bacteroidaceae bacterium]
MRSLLFILITAWASLTHASDTNYLVIHLSSGTRLTLPVEDRPQITFDGSVLCISTERFLLSDILKYTFSENDAVGIETIDADKPGVSLKRLDGEKIAVGVKDASAMVRVYSASGVEQPIRRTASEEGAVTLDLTGLVPGVYVISVGGETLKIRKK